MKTLHITNAWHGASGGIRTFYQEMMKAAERHARPLRLVVPSETTRVEEVNKYARIYHLAAPRSLFFDARYRLLLPHTYLAPTHRTLREILQAENPDLLEVCDKYSLCWLAGLIRKGWLPTALRPTLVGLSCERLDDNVAAWLTAHPFTQKLSRLYLSKLYLPLFDYHIANSRYTAEELRQAVTARHDRIVMVRPMGVDSTAFTPTRRQSEARLKLLHLVGGNERTRLLLYAGRLSREKNLPLLLQTMRALCQETTRDFHLLIAGAGPLENWLRQEGMRLLPGRIHLLGQLQNQTALAALYANCDAFLHPNPREPFGIAPLEAMASGLPVVAPNAGGVLSYANDENAWLAEPEEVAFAAAVRDVFSDDEVKWHRLRRARRTAERFDWEEVTAGFFTLYDSLHQLAQREITTGRFSKAKSGKPHPATI